METLSLNAINTSDFRFAQEMNALLKRKGTISYTILEYGTYKGLSYVTFYIGGFLHKIEFDNSKKLLFRLVNKNWCKVHELDVETISLKDRNLVLSETMMIAITFINKQTKS